MSTPSLPPEIRVVHEGMSLTRYILPRRNLGNARKGGWVPVGIGLFITIFMIFWMSGPIASGLHDHGAGRWIGVGFGLLGLPGLLVGIAVIALGVVILTNASHSEIVVGDGMIRAIERVGFIPIPRKRFITQLTQLVVQKGGFKVTDPKRGTTTTLAKDLALLEAETTTGKSLWLAPGYPHAMLRPLADVLAASMSLGSQGASALSNEEPVVEIEVVERDSSEPEPDIEVPRPANTDITCQEAAHGLAISVPPKGLWRGSQGLFAFSLLWNGFMIVFTGGMLKAHPPLPVYLFISLFWVIGIGVLLGAINMARRKVMIAVVNNVLACRIIGPFKTREQTIPVGNIGAIRVGPSGMEVNHRPVMEIQIIPRTGKKIGILSNRSSDEQEWLAYVLRRWLKVGR